MERTRYRLIVVLALAILVAATSLIDGCKKQDSSSGQTQPKKTSQKQLDKAMDDM
jgi:type IV pilus biogenesis protein CpaD/CtpE